MRGFSPKIGGQEAKMKLNDIFIPVGMSESSRSYPNISSTVLPSNMQVHGRVNRVKDKEVDYLDILEKSRGIVILGDPGSGKSTLLKHIALKVVEARGENSLMSGMVPVHTRASEYAEYFKRTQKPLYDYIIEANTSSPFREFIIRGFNSSNILLMIDGLDEITNTQLRKSVTEKFEEMTAMFPYCNYIITSRIVGYNEARVVGEVTHLEIQPFETEEIKQFCYQWNRSIAVGYDCNDVESMAKELFNSIQRSQSIIKLASNPLLMTIIAMIHYKGKKLPNRRAELYDCSTDTFLDYWVTNRIGDESILRDKNDIKEMLAPIAFEMHMKYSNGLIPEEDFRELFIKKYLDLKDRDDNEATKEYKGFLKFIREYAGFFYEKGEDDKSNRLYGFIHLTFEEYLAAIEFMDRWDESNLKLEDYIFDARWQEVIRLTAAVLNQSAGNKGRKEASKFLDDILNADDPFEDGHRGLILALRILTDEVVITKEVLSKILNKTFWILSQKHLADLIIELSGILGYLLSTIYAEDIIKKIKLVISENSDTVFLSALIYILMDNSGNNDLHGILEEALKRDEKKREIIYETRVFYSAFSNSKVYLDNLHKYINMKCNVDSYVITNLLYEHASIDLFPVFNLDNLKEVVKVLGKVVNSDLADNLCKKLINVIADELYNNPEYIKAAVDILKDLDSKYESYIDKALEGVSKLSGLRGQVKDTHIEVKLAKDRFRVIGHTVRMDSPEANALNKKVHVLIYDTNDEFLESIILNKKNIRKRLERYFGNNDINKQFFYYSIVSFLEIDTKADVDKFIKLYNENNITELRADESCLLIRFIVKNLFNNEEDFAKILFENYQALVSARLEPHFRSRFLTTNLKLLKESQFIPLRLAYYYITGETYCEEFLSESLEYYKTCINPTIKKGMFEILNRFLSPLN